MALVVERGLFTSLEEALADVAKHGTWPNAIVSPASDGIAAHWHDVDVHAYIMEGETDFLDAATGERIPVSAGDKMVVPARAVHAEGVVEDRVVYILALPEPSQPGKVLELYSPEDL